MRIAVWGNFGIGNLGNECTLQAIAGGLRARDPACEILTICSNAADVTARHGLEAYLFRESSAKSDDTRLTRAARRAFGEPLDCVRAAARLRGVDGLIVAGTGIITDARERMFGLPFELLRWCTAARLVGAKVLFASVGVEAIIHTLSRAFMWTALRSAQYRSYRDGLSRD